MSSRTTTARIVHIDRDRLDEAVAVLVAAFADDHLMRWVLGEQDPATQAQLVHELMRFSCELRIAMGWPLLGCTIDGDLVGVAGLTSPERPPWPPDVVAMHDWFKASLSREMAERWDQYVAIADQCPPVEPHYYLGVIGVHPRAQGKGCGRLLLDRTHAIADAHPDAVGVYLDTCNPANVDLYEHFGYRVIRKTALDRIHVWCMGRPRRPA